MKAKTTALPIRWFLFAGLISLAMSVAIVMLLLRPNSYATTPPLPGIDKPNNSGRTADDNQKYSQPDQAIQETFSLQQSTPDGRTIPWGEISPAAKVHLEVVALHPTASYRTTIELSQNKQPFHALKGNGFSVITSDLPEGRYYWRAILQRGKSAAYILTPQQMNPDNTDFIIPPTKLKLIRLEQRQLDETPIGADLHANRATRLTGFIHYPRAILDVEVKPAGIAFDGVAVQSSPVSEAESATCIFSGNDGSYHWRARARATDGTTTEWHEFRRTPNADFILVHPPQQEPGENMDKHFAEAGPQLASGGSGMHDPLPSIVTPPPSLWSLMLSPRIMLLAGLNVSLLIVWLVFPKVASRRKLKTSKRQAK